MHLGIPVVPEENRITNGYPNGTCSNVSTSLASRLAAPLLRKLSSVMLLDMSCMSSIESLKNGINITCSIESRALIFLIIK